MADKWMNHDVMQRAAERPITGEGATATVAASGGLEVPGRELHGLTDVVASSGHELIPGEREQDTALMMSHAFGEEQAGFDIESTLDEETRHEHAREGGGG
jgi:hypothetical protein